MTKKKRVRITVDQVREIGRRLDRVIEIGHVGIYRCECDVCKDLDKYVISLGLRTPASSNERRALQAERTKASHAKDAVRIANLAARGINRIEIANKMGRSVTYITRIMAEFDIDPPE